MSDPDLNDLGHGNLVLKIDFQFEGLGQRSHVWSGKTQGVTGLESICR